MSIDASTEAANDDNAFDLQSQAHSGNRCRVLLVFSQAHIVRVLKTQLDQYNCQINIACSAESALKMVHTGGYDAVVIDVDLPVMGGVQLCASINRQLQHKKPQLFLAGDSDSVLAAAQSDWPVKASYLGWPINVSRLLGTILAPFESTLANKKISKQG